LSVLYSFIFTVVALPPAVLLWERYSGRWSSVVPNAAASE
jgi:hypothetical protein